MKPEDILSRLTDDQLKAVSKGDLSGLDDLTLHALSNSGKPEPDYFHEPGLTDVSATPLTQPDFKQMGDETAADYAKMGHPTVGKVVGAGVEHLPDLASMLVPLPG